MFLSVDKSDFQQIWVVYTRVTRFRKLFISAGQIILLRCFQFAVACYVCVFFGPEAKEAFGS